MLVIFSDKFSNRNGVGLSEPWLVAFASFRGANTHHGWFHADFSMEPLHRQLGRKAEQTSLYSSANF